MKRKPDLDSIQFTLKDITYEDFLSLLTRFLKEKLPLPSSLSLDRIEETAPGYYLRMGFEAPTQRNVFGTLDSILTDLQDGSLDLKGFGETLRPYAGDPVQELAPLLGNRILHVIRKLKYETIGDVVADIEKFKGPEGIPRRGLGPASAKKLYAQLLNYAGRNQPDTTEKVRERGLLRTLKIFTGFDSITKGFDLPPEILDVEVDLLGLGTKAVLYLKKEGLSTVRKLAENMYSSIEFPKCRIFSHQCGDVKNSRISCAIREYAQRYRPNQEISVSD